MANRWKILLLLESKEFKGFVEALFPYSCLFTSVARVIKKINMSYTTIPYNGRKELRSYFRLGNVTEILIFKCRQKTRLSQRVMHGIHFIPVTKALIFPWTTTLIEIRATYQHIEHANTPQSLMFSDAL